MSEQIEKNAMPRHVARTALAAAAFLIAASLAHAESLYVANDGSDGTGCGPKASPCRSIGQAIAHAQAGDSIIVGPGRYGDLNGNGILGELGEENPDVFSPGCGCVLGINQSVSLTSSDGAAATVIEARSIPSQTNVLIIGNGVQFGKPGKGFTVTQTAGTSGPFRAADGIVIDATPVKVSGNQVIGFPDLIHSSGIVGIRPVNNDGEEVLIEGNQVMGWANGILLTSASKTVRKNQLSLNDFAVEVNPFGFDIPVGGIVVEGNVITDNNFGGVDIEGPGTVVGNTINGNGGSGLSATHPGPGATSSALIEKNNVLGNGYPRFNSQGDMASNCGLVNQGIDGLVAADNYWGAATGPGGDPADAVCDFNGTTTATPFATVPFKVKAPVKP